MDLIDNHKNALAYLGKITHFWNFVILELDWWWWMHCALLAPLLAEILNLTNPHSKHCRISHNTVVIYWLLLWMLSSESNTWKMFYLNVLLT